MVTSGPATELEERGRRKPAASGTPVVLADGNEWLLAIPSYLARSRELTSPGIDSPLDRVFDCLVLGEGVSLCDVWEIAGALLRHNYDLSDEDLEQLLSVAPGTEARRLTSSVLDVALGSERHPRSYCRWVRASLLVSGLGETAISSEDLPDVLAVLVASNRTVPVSQFVDACKVANERASLEFLV